MELKQAIPEDAAERYGQILGEHVARGCGDFTHGPASCTCRCVDHPCGLPEAEPSRCRTCGDAGFLAVDLRHVELHEYRRMGRRVVCPDCDAGLPALAPMLPWGGPVRYGVDQLPPTAPETAAIAEWLNVEVETRPFLVLVGPGGYGKTFDAISIGMALARSGRTVEYYTAANLLADVRKTFNRPERSVEDVTYHAEHDDALVLDDLGAEQATDFADAELLRIVNGRYEARKVTVVTANRAGPEGDRLWHRLRDRRLARLVTCRFRNWRAE